MDATAQELVARLRRNPNDQDAFAALRAHYQRIGDYASLANLLEGWASRSPDRRAGARAMFDAGELVLGALADRERAITMYHRALELDPKCEDAFLRLRGLFEDGAEMRRLADLLEKQAKALARANGDDRDIALLYHQLGEIWEHRFTRVDKAVGYYKKAFEADGQLVAAIYAAREIYRAAGNLKAAATLLEREAKVESDPARGVALWRELAHMRSEDLDDPEGATMALKRALAAAPGDMEVMSDLARVYLARARRSDDAHVSASDRHRAADLLYQMAQHVPSEHALAYLEQALDARPDHDGAMALFERIAEEMGEGKRLPARWVAYLGHAPDRPEAAVRRKRLAHAYLDAGQLDYAITCLEWLLESEDAEAAETLVDLYRRAGREDDAIRALGIAARGLPPRERIPRLRELITALRDQGDLSQAGTFATEILKQEPGDPEALHTLEESCRSTGEWAPLREALLAASRIGGLDPGVRMSRLKQVALLSERELDDLDGAISAWRGVAALDPSEPEARRALERLLTTTERWDDLAAHLEREGLGITDPQRKADLYRRLAILHRESRGDLQSAIGVLRDLRDLLPDDVQGRDMLCDVLLEAGATLEAIPILRERIAQSGGPARAGLLRTLATVLEEQVGDSEGAFVAWAELLETEPSDLDALSHMVSIDEAAGEWERLLSTLSYKVEVIPPEQQPAVLAKMAAIADESLADLARAAELYARALERAPGNGIVLDALCSVYERSDRYKDLVVLLRETAIHETDARRRAELYRRIARTLAGQVGNDDAAAEAWREVLKAGEDEEALRFLHRHAARRDHVEVLEDVLSRLSTLVTDPNEQREVLLDRAHLLADRLERPRDAILDLRKVVEELAPEDLGALTKLSELCEAVQDLPGLADALWRQLDVLTDQDLRVPVARRLADLHEKEAPEVARAVDALSRWADADPTDPVPMRRLVSLLESASRWAELCTAVDRLAGLEPAEEASRLVRKSAEVAYRQLGDVDGAWARLAPRVRDGDADAEADLRTLAEGSGRGAALSELYVELAQTLPDPADQKRRWMDAAQVQESALGDPKNALEAVLRAFAVDLEDEGPLDEADRLAELAGAWPRLAQVYETLIRQRDAAPDKVRLLLRHAALLDTRANDTNTALDHTLRAYSLSPADDEVLALAEERAARAGRADELLVSYDKRRSAAEDDAGRVEALLRSVRWSEKTLLNRELATQYLAQAVALTVRTPEQAEPLEAGARALDAEPGGPGAESGLRQALVTIYAMLADDMEENPVGGAQLLHRASRLLADDLGDSDAAFAAIKKAAAFAPADDTVLDALEAFALRLERLEALDQHFAFLIDEALDSRTAAGLLRRRANLLEQKLGRYEDAAEVWSRLASVDSSDTEARDRLRNALRKAGKHQDLLVALQRDLRRADPEERIPVLIRIAEVWDQDIQNRWEAIDAWKKVLAEAPGHPTATASMARLERASKRPQPDSDLMIDAPPDVANAELVSDDLVSAELVSDDLVSEDLVLSDSDLASAEPGTDQHALPPVGDDFDDLTMNSDETEIPDSSETLMDDGLRADLVAELSAPAALPDVPSAATADEPAEDDDEDSLRPPPRRGVRTAQTAQLRPPREGEAPPLPASRPAIDPNRLLPGPPGEFEDDYTAVADDVFDQLRPSSPDDIEVLGTGEIELFDEPAEDETMDMPAQRLPDLEQEILGAAPADDSADSVESLDDPGAFEELGAIEELSGVEELSELSGVEELDDLEEIEELDDLEEIEPTPPKTSMPPPPPPRRK